MSNDNVSANSLLDKFNIKSTRFAYLLFAVFSFLIITIFLSIVASEKTSLRDEVSSLVEMQLHISKTNRQLDNEVLNSFNKSLLYNQTSKETDRFEAIYSLQNTKRLLEEYIQKMSYLEHDEQFEDELSSLKGSLTDFDLLIAQSVNSDKKVLDLIAQFQHSQDSTSQYLFESEDILEDPSETSNIESLMADIQNQLFVMDNQSAFIIEKMIKGLSSNQLSYIAIIFVLLFFGGFFLFTWFVLFRTRATVNSLSKVFNIIAKGELPNVTLQLEKDFSPLLNAGNEIIGYLNSASEFAKHIGEGAFDYKFEPKSEQDALGNSLIDMQSRLLQVTREDKIRNWVNEGQAKFGELLRQYNDDLDKLGTNLISNLVDYLKANQGALFVLKEEGDDQYLELLSAYAFNRKKFVERKLQIGEGLAGQAFSEGKTIYLKDIRTDHYNIITGLGESKPTSLLIVPLKEEDKIEGIIEIASFKEIQAYEIEFIESIGESIASSLSTGKINETTKQLLNETQEKAEEMKAQEEELRQNMEELAATQEQMERRNKELEEIQQKFDQERYLLNALLNSTNDRIYFKDLESKFVRVSQSMIDLFDKESEKEVLGKSDFDFGFEEHAKVAYEDEQRIIKTGRPLEDVVEKEQWDDGRVTWVSTTKNPLKDLEGKTVGTFGISRDVTKSKLTELEMEKRKEWLESFFTYETIAFVVLDQNGNVAYATTQLLGQLGAQESTELKFNDIFANKSFEEFLEEIRFEAVKDEKVVIDLALNDEDGTVGSYMVVSGGKENEDGSSNIFIIRK